MSAIRLENVRKSYDTELVLKGLSLEVKQGEVYGFIGKNGAGKTTTINIIMSLIHKNSGDVIIADNLVDFHDQSYKNKIGYVPDVPVFPGYMTAHEYLHYTGEIYKMKHSLLQTKIDEVLEFVGLKKSKKTIGGYSRGMKQRLAIAQAMIHDPEIFIMDEPTSALDPIGRKDVMNIILKLKGEKTIFYSTHILEDVEKVCDRIAILDGGKIVIEDAIESIKKEYYTDKIYIETTSNPELLKNIVDNKTPIKGASVQGLGVACRLTDEYGINDILNQIMEEGEDIIEMRQLEMNLEDIFIQITNENNT